MDDHGNGAEKSRSTAWLAVLLVLALSAETFFLRAHLSRFFPNIPTPELSVLYSFFWPESTKLSHDDEGAPIDDWLGLEEFISGIKLSSSQEQKLRPIEDQMLIYADYAQKDYTDILKCLTPRQIELLKEPQKRVSDHLALGIDCVGKDQQLFCLNQLYELSFKYNAPDTKLKKTSQNTASEKDLPVYIAPTRLMVSLSRLIEDGKEPITPEQAQNILDCFSALRNNLSEVHNLYPDALEVLSVEQIQQANKSELRHYEAFLSPIYLKTLKNVILKRRKGSAA